MTYRATPPSSPPVSGADLSAGQAGAPRYAQVIRAVCERPWAILPETLETMIEVLNLRSADERFSDEELIARIGARGDDSRSGGISPPRGVAHLQLFGVLSQRMNLFSAISGGTSTEVFLNEFNQALADASVHAILIEIDSPGGDVYGVTELADAIYEARETKPIYAIANSMAASGAYWIGSAASHFALTPSGEVGSIGVYTVHRDWSVRNAKQGLAVTYVSAGPKKVLANPDEPLTGQGRQTIQERVDSYYQMFLEAVAKGRDEDVETVEQDFGQGALVGATEALDVGMVDEVASLREYMEQISDELNEAPGRPGARAVSRKAQTGEETKMAKTKVEEAPEEATLNMSALTADALNDKRPDLVAELTRAAVADGEKLSAEAADAAVKAERERAVALTKAALDMDMPDQLAGVIEEGLSARDGELKIAKAKLAKRDEGAPTSPGASDDDIATGKAAANAGKKFGEMSGKERLAAAEARATEKNISRAKALDELAAEAKKEKG